MSSSTASRTGSRADECARADRNRSGCRRAVTGSPDEPSPHGGVSGARAGGVVGCQRARARVFLGQASSQRHRQEHGRQRLRSDSSWRHAGRGAPAACSNKRDEFGGPDVLGRGRHRFDCSSGCLVHPRHDRACMRADPGHSVDVQSMSSPRCWVIPRRPFSGVFHRNCPSGVGPLVPQDETSSLIRRNRSELEVVDVGAVAVRLVRRHRHEPVAGVGGERAVDAAALERDHLVAVGVEDLHPVVADAVRRRCRSTAPSRSGRRSRRRTAGCTSRRSAGRRRAPRPVSRSRTCTWPRRRWWSRSTPSSVGERDGTHREPLVADVGGVGQRRRPEPVGVPLGVGVVGLAVRAYRPAALRGLALGRRHRDVEPAVGPEHGAERARPRRQVGPASSRSTGESRGRRRGRPGRPSCRLRRRAAPAGPRRARAARSGTARRRGPAASPSRRWPGP